MATYLFSFELSTIFILMEKKELLKELIVSSRKQFHKPLVARDILLPANRLPSTRFTTN